MKWLTEIYQWVASFSDIEKVMVILLFGCLIADVLLYRLLRRRRIEELRTLYEAIRKTR